MSESAGTGPCFLCTPWGIRLVRNKSKVGDSSFYRGNSEGPSKNQLKNDTRYFEEFCELEESGNLSLVSELKAV